MILVAKTQVKERTNNRKNAAIALLFMISPPFPSRKISTLEL